MSHTSKLKTELVLEDLCIFSKVTEPRVYGTLAPSIIVPVADNAEVDKEEQGGDGEGESE